MNLREVSNAKGFTLIELLLVVAIVTMLGVMSTAFYSRFLTQNILNNVTDQLAGSLRKAQMYSMFSKRNSAWGVAWNAAKIYVFAGNTFATRNAAFDETYAVNSNISITGFTEVDFARATGIPNITFTATITAPVGSKTVSINTQGVVSK